MAPKGMIVRRNGERRYIFHDEVEKYVSEGWVPVRSEVVEARGSERLGEITPEEFTERMRLGETPELVDEQITRDLLDQRYKEEAFDTIGNELLTGAAGVASSLSLGLSDVAVDALGGGEKLSDMRDVNPYWDVGGQIAGAVASGFTTGALGNAARFTPAGKLLQGTAKVEKALRPRIGKAGALAVEGALDGALFAGGHAATKSLFGNDPMTAEAAAADIGSNALLGGVLGGAIGLGTTGFGRLSRRLDAKKAAELKATEEAVAQQAAAEAYDEALRNAKLGVAGARLTKAEQTAAKQAAVRAAAQAKKDFRAAQREADSIDKAYKKSIQSDLTGYKADVRKFSDRVLKNVDDLSKEATGGIEFVEGAAVQTQKSMVDRLTKADFDLIPAPVRARLALKTNKATKDFGLLQYRDLARREAAAIKQSTAKLKSIAGGKKFADLDAKQFNEFTEEYGKLQTLFKQYDDTLDPIERFANVSLRRKAAKLDEGLFHAEEFDRLAKNNKHTEFLAQPLFGEAGELTQAGQLLKNELGVNIEALQNSPTLETMARVWGAGKVLEGTAGNLGGTAAKAVAVREGAESIKAQTAEAVEQAKAAQLAADEAGLEVARRQFELSELQATPRPKAPSVKPESPGPVVSNLGFFGGTVGRIISRIDGARRAVANKVDDGVRGFIRAAGKPRKGTVPTAVAVLQGVRFDNNIGVKPRKRKFDKTTEAFLDRSEEIKRAVENPGRASKKAMDALSGVNAMDPGLAKQIHDNALKKLMYLYGLLPKNPNQTGFGPDRFVPSRTEVDKFARIVRAAEKPMSILDDLNSHKLTQEAVDTVKYLYPEIYANIQMQFIDNMDFIMENVSYRGRVQLGILFQVPADEVLRPGFIATMQDNFAKRDLGAEQEGQFSTPGSLQKSLTNQQTASQRIEQ